MARSRNRRNRARGGHARVLQLIYSLAAISAVFIAAVIFFRVDKVNVTGNMRYQTEEILAAAEIEKGDNLFMLNKSALVRKLNTALPYLDEITVMQALPDRVEITVSECVPLAYVEYEGAYFTLDYKGKTLSREAAPPQLAPLTGFTPLAPTPGYKLAVAEDERDRLKTLSLLLAALEQRGILEHVTAIDASDLRHLYVVYDGRITMQFAYSTDYTNISRTALAILNNESMQYDKGVLDLTKDDGRAYFQIVN